LCRIASSIPIPIIPAAPAWRGRLRQPLDPGIGFGFGWAVVTDPVAAQAPWSKGTYRWGGAYGHSWFVDPQKALTNTALEGMWGQFTVDLRNAIYGAL